MRIYDLFLDSGPMMKKTMVQVPALPGCVARGDTTAAALDHTPDAIRAFTRFLARHGERINPDATFTTRVAEHVTNSGFPGNGIGFINPDRKPLSKLEIERLLACLAWIHKDIRRLTSPLSPKQLTTQPSKGRPIQRILSHICTEGAYLRAVSGASRIQREVDEGRLDANDALDRLLGLEAARLRAMNAAERGEVIMRGQSRWSARSAVRRMLEHGWEHYTEIAARLGVDP